MIEIDEENKKIFFYYSKEDIKKNDKRDDEMHEFDLLSCHKCPDCGKVIDAYYIGSLPIGDSSNEYYGHPYLPSNAGYNRYAPHYKYGHKYGGGYLIMYNHNDTLCKSHIASVAGITEGIKSVINFIIPTPEIVPTDYELKNFASSILENKIPGVSFIEDVCNQRAPLLAVNKKEFAKSISCNGFSEFDKEYKWGLLFYKLIINDKEVKIVEAV